MNTAVTLFTYHQTCVTCGIYFGVPIDFDKKRREDGGPFYCPNGHRQHYTDTEVAKLTRELARKDQELAQQKEETTRQRARANREERRVSAQKGINTKLKNKIANGTCPCCDKLFPDLAGHMATEHPDYEAAKDDDSE